MSDDATGQAHKPNPRQTQGRWRVDCSCGWKGPSVALPGQGHEPWAEHFRSVPHTIEELIDASSLGTPEAKAVRARTPRHVVDRIMQRVEEGEAFDSIEEDRREFERRMP